MADVKKRENVFARIKANLHDTEDDNDDSLYKNIRPGGGPGGGRDYRKPKDAKGTSLRILRYAVSNKLLFVGVFLLLILSTGCNLAASYYLKPLVDDYIVPNITAQVKDYGGLARQLLILAGIYLVSVVASYLQSRAMVNLSQRAVNTIRKDLFSKLQDLPISYYDAHTHGELMSRFTNDADQVQMALEQSLIQLISGVITFIGTISLMLVISWRLFLITLVVVALSILFVRKTSKRSKILFKKQQAALGRLNGYIEEMIEGLKVIKAFTYEKRSMEEFDALDDKYRENAILANFLGQSMMPILGALMNISYAVTAVAGGALVLSGGFTLGSLGVYLNYTRQVSMPVNMISNQVVTLMSAIAGAERIFAVIDAEPEVDEGKVSLVTVNRDETGALSQTKRGERTGFWAWKCPQGPDSTLVRGVVGPDGTCTPRENGPDWLRCLKQPDGTTVYRPVQGTVQGEGAEAFELIQLQGDVRLKDVHFSYVPGKPVLKGISVYAKPGQKIAFVGSTGAGKTTITNLINRFYEIDSGTITFDGIDITAIEKAGLRRSLGVVLQDTNLFTGTVMDNIRYGKLDATDEECIAAAKSANAHGFITRLPNGYQTEITNNGRNISQGQRQLLAIARTAVAKHPVMIMDEATSSIDTRTEKLIESGMDSLMEGKTVFVIAHRLSTVRNSKVIAVIEHGEIVEKGSHQELLALQGRYYLLYTGQHELE